MAYEAFDAGLAPDGIKDTNDIKILICYLLKNVDEPLTSENISEILLRDGLVNYFELVKAVDDLLVSGHIDLVMQGEQKCYRSTNLGNGTAGLFERRLPYSVREKAVKAAINLLAKIKRESENSVEITENTSGGLNVCCKILDMGDALLSINLFVPDKPQAEMVKKQFLANPELVYKGVLSLLTGDNDAVRDILKLNKESEKK
jgi:hypothetical protein